MFEDPTLGIEFEEDELRMLLEGDASKSDVMQHLFGKLGDKNKHIAVEFECGECCKKVLNGAKVFVLKGLLILLPAKGECLFLKVISCGKVADKQILNFIIIPLDRVCAVEFGAVQIDP